jgi:hypothetical protein
MMPTIELQYGKARSSGNQSQPKKQDAVTTASVGSSPGRLHYATVDGKSRCFERTGTNASGQEIYREQVGA